MSELDEPMDFDLYHKVQRADWNIGHVATVTTGKTVTFRRHYTSDAPGVEKRQVHGENVNDAIRTFLAELAEQDAG